MSFQQLRDSASAPSANTRILPAVHTKIVLVGQSSEVQVCEVFFGPSMEQVLRTVLNKSIVSAKRLGLKHIPVLISGFSSAIVSESVLSSGSVQLDLGQNGLLPQPPARLLRLKRSLSELKVAALSYKIQAMDRPRTFNFATIYSVGGGKLSQFWEGSEPKYSLIVKSAALVGKEVDLSDVLQPAYVVSEDELLCMVTYNDTSDLNDIAPADEKEIQLLLQKVSLNEAVIEISDAPMPFVSANTNIATKSAQTKKYIVDLEDSNEPAPQIVKQNVPVIEPAKNIQHNVPKPIKKEEKRKENSDSSDFFGCVPKTHQDFKIAHQSQTQVKDKITEFYKLSKLEQTKQEERELSNNANSEVPIVQIEAPKIYICDEASLQPLISLLVGSVTCIQPVQQKEPQKVNQTNNDNIDEHETNKHQNRSDQEQQTDFGLLLQNVRVLIDDGDIQHEDFKISSYNEETKTIHIETKHKSDVVSIQKQISNSRHHFQSQNECLMSRQEFLQ